MSDGAGDDERSPLPASRLVWYAAYGSNLSRERFDVYLRGGTPAGGAHEYPGCRNETPPIDDRSWQCGFRMRFGGSSRTWGGGVALIDDAQDGVPARVRLYLITLEQFADVVAQENWLEPGSVDLTEVTFAPHHVIGPDHVYRVVLQVGEIDGSPVLTITQDPSAPTATPTMRYLTHIARGLREAHGLDAGGVVDYLLTRPGVAGANRRAELVAGLAST
jgi:hypothetical protein